jgi:hypothetical protein
MTPELANLVERLTKELAEARAALEEDQKMSALKLKSLAEALAEARREIDEALALSEPIRTLKDLAAECHARGIRAESLAEENTRLREGLKKYGQHEEECDFYYEEHLPCSCGYKAALAAEKPEAEMVCPACQRGDPCSENDRLAAAKPAHVPWTCPIGFPGTCLHHSHGQCHLPMEYRIDCGKRAALVVPVETKEESGT